MSERDILVECRGHDAAKICNVDHAHGWQEDVMGMLEEKHGKCKVSISFECETLKADEAAEDHIKKFMPKLSGMGAVGGSGEGGVFFPGEILCFVKGILLPDDAFFLEETGIRSKDGLSFGETNLISGEGCNPGEFFLPTPFCSVGDIFAIRIRRGILAFSSNSCFLPCLHKSWQEPVEALR
ncbi:uncharacterized protein [Primulina huaijiensis]|uniref:uncharacterized protein isoform X4 n=1 Tax=Primulina huaijiensis TaxID=1492673 RepID=UPI003CC716D8